MMSCRTLGILLVPSYTLRQVELNTAEAIISHNPLVRVRIALDRVHGLRAQLESL